MSEENLYCSTHKSIISIFCKPCLKPLCKLCFDFHKVSHNSENTIIELDNMENYLNEVKNNLTKLSFLFHEDFLKFVNFENNQKKSFDKVFDSFQKIENKIENFFRNFFGEFKRKIYKRLEEPLINNFNDFKKVFSNIKNEIQEIEKINEDINKKNSLNILQNNFSSEDYLQKKIFHKKMKDFLKHYCQGYIEIDVNYENLFEKLNKICTEFNVRIIKENNSSTNKIEFEDEFREPFLNNKDYLINNDDNTDESSMDNSFLKNIHLGEIIFKNKK